MIPNMPTLGIRFDIGKIRSGYYGADCWRVFWRVVDPQVIREAVLFEGDTTATLNRSENAFCIAIQSMDGSILKTVKDSLSASEEFKRVCASQMFVEGVSVTAEPLVEAGRIDYDGNLVGDAGASRSALGAIRRERQAAYQAPEPAATVVPRAKPASKRTRDLPELSSFEELQKLLEKTFKPKEWEYADYWLTPEELCDVVEKYAELIEVQWMEDSCGLSEDMLYVSLFEKNPPEGGPIEFLGLFAFPSALDAAQFAEEYSSAPAYAKVLPLLAGIQGKYQLNFSGKEGNPRDITYEKENEISPDSLWMKICVRRECLGIPMPKPAGTGPGGPQVDQLAAPEMLSPVSTSQKPTKKKWWQFWR